MSISRDQDLFNRYDVCLVVYDDGSTDGTACELSRIERRLGTVLRVLRSDDQTGKSAALNAIAAYAKERVAEYLCFVDGDVELGYRTLSTLLRAIEGSAPGSIVSCFAVPNLKRLRFPLREMYGFKSDCEPFRCRYRTYVNGRTFGLRLRDFPLLPSDLRQCDDRYLTVTFGKRRIVSCQQAVVVYSPPATVRAYFYDRMKTQWRLIRLARVAPSVYRQLRNRRFSVAHSYFGSFPAGVKATLLSRMRPRLAIALTVGRVLEAIAKACGEVGAFVGDASRE